MDKQIKELVLFTATLEHLLNEHEEWVGVYLTYGIKRDTLQRHGEAGEELRLAIEELDERTTQAETLMEGTEVDLCRFADVQTTEQARKHLINLKSVLNTYAIKTGQEFINTNELEQMSAEDVLAAGMEMIPNE